VPGPLAGIARGVADLFRRHALAGKKMDRILDLPAG